MKGPNPSGSILYHGVSGQNPVVGVPTIRAECSGTVADKESPGLTTRMARFAPGYDPHNSYGGLRLHPRPEYPQLGCSGVSGVAVLLVHPRLYWGETGSLETPSLVDLPLPFVFQTPECVGPGAVGLVRRFKRLAFMCSSASLRSTSGGICALRRGILLLDRLRGSFTICEDDQRHGNPSPITFLSGSLHRSHFLSVPCGDLDRSRDVARRYIRVSRNRKSTGRATIRAHDPLLYCGCVGRFFCWAMSGWFR